MKNIKIVIAPDSFKGSISAYDCAVSVSKGLKKGFEAIGGYSLETVICPIADGGEGTLDTLVPAAEQISVRVTSTDGGKTDALIGFKGDTAIIEMAKAAGLTLVPEAKRSAVKATTYGVGEMMIFALDKGYRSILLTVGGSGTNDGGCGMAAALGVKFLDKDNKEFVPTGGTLSQIARIDPSGLDERLGECKITIATDVTNPLLGERGATYVYARQKGADDRELDDMELGMTSYAALLKDVCGKDVASIPGCGAGGGTSAPLLAFTSATIKSGIRAVLETLSFDTILYGADAVITGEGKIDRQSLYGKAISGVAEYASRYSLPLYCFVGLIGDDKDELLKMGLNDIFELASIAPSPEYSMTHADLLLEELAENFVINNYK